MFIQFKSLSPPKGGNMLNFRKKVVLTLLITLIWCILNEKFNIATATGGILVSFVTLYLLKILQPPTSKTFNYNIGIFGLFKYLVFVIADIYRSAFRAILHILKGEVNPQFVAASTRIKKPWLQALIANAITLTPGTVTIHLNDGEYTILWLYPLSIRPKSISKILVQDFENLLKKEDRRA